jgi:hypothetical protein
LEHFGIFWLLHNTFQPFKSVQAQSHNDHAAFLYRPPLKMHLSCLLVLAAVIMPTLAIPSTFNTSAGTTEIINTAAADIAVPQIDGNDLIACIRRGPTCHLKPDLQAGTLSFKCDCDGTCNGLPGANDNVV